ncbi:hypothetical protein ACSBR2_006197 [Camellia fascicularis]
MNGKLPIVVFHYTRTFQCLNQLFILLFALEFHGYRSGISNAITRTKFHVSKEGLIPLNNSRKSYRKSMLIPRHAGNLSPNYSQQLQYPDLSEQELIVKSIDYMKEQFLQSLSSDDTSMQSVSSNQAPDLEENLDQDENEFTVLAGKAQDPVDNEPNLGDF